MSRLLLSILSCMVLGLPLLAQPNEPPPATFRILSACGSYSNLFYDIGSGSHKITVSVNINQSISAPLLCPKESRLDIYRIIPPPPNAPEGTLPTHQVVVSALLPSNPAGCIVVTFPTSTTPTAPLQAHIVPPASDTHHAGTMMVVNFSSYVAGVALDEHQSTFDPGAIGIAHTGTGRVLLQVAVKKGGRWAKAFRGERRIAPELRSYVFIFNYMVDPDYGADDIPPPATVKTFFEVSPETIAKR